LKSKGIREVEDGTLIIKASFTAKPGMQSMPPGCFKGSAKCIP
jgi:hypothetical protein